ncbi:MAG: hypothetical protein NT116_00200 [Candidatus Parcubacteria bacterium]|nr:hypothetical protein [Candidatus Parcubacteria bacterium]
MEGGSFSLAEIEDCLANSAKLKKFITTKSGFYFLKNPPSRKATADLGREELIKIRQERYNLAEKKFKIARRAVKIFKFLPFVKMVSVCNSLAYSNAKADSDIDLFIITSPGRIWLTRLFIIGIIWLLGLRPHEGKATDKICLSYYITTENLDLSGTRILDIDVHLIFWLSTFWKIYDRDNYFTKFYQANSWLKKYLPNWQQPQYGLRRLVADNNFNKTIYKILEFAEQGQIGAFFDSLAKKLQLKYMSQQKKDLAVVGDKSVIISDTILKFHLNDRRRQYLEMFEKNRQAIMDKI